MSICRHVLLAIHLLKNFEKMWTLCEFWKINFGIFAENFDEMLEVLRTLLRYFENILWKWLEYFYEISWKLQKKEEKLHSKFWINSGKITEKHRGNFKLLILRKLRRILKMFLSNFSEIMKKIWRKVRNILYLQIFKRSDRNFVTFLCQYLEKLVKNYPKNMKLL